MSMSSDISPVGLLCEYTVNPLGLDIKHPRFSWRLENARRGLSQRGYQLLVASSPSILDQNTGDFWDSGIVESSASVNVPYSGAELNSRTKYYWKVRILDDQGHVSKYSPSSSFEMAFLDPKEWKAQWIACMSMKPYPTVPLFRKELHVHKTVQDAKVYISGIGYYELRINGRKVGNHVLDPGWTDYTKRVLYSVYDVTDMLTIGNNAVGVMLGIGWYRFPDQAASSQCITQLILQMHIRYTDNEEVIIVSDRNSDWYTSSEGPILLNSIYDGETYDARLEKTGWDLPGYDMNKDGLRCWVKPMVMDGPGGILQSQAIEPIQVIADIKPISLQSPKPDTYVYDFGQNFAGWVQLRVSGPAGNKVVLKFSELLYENGTVNRENLRSAKAVDTYIVKGEGLEMYEPRFTYHGFRYVQLEGFPGMPALDTISGRVVRSSVEPAGSFECSNGLINQIHRNIV